jgi:fibronectin type 3 domain-containing protein
VYRATGTSIDLDGASPVNSEGPVSGTSFTDQSAENGTTYRYRVTAVDDSDNESAPSDSVLVTPFADPPTRP